MQNFKIYPQFHILIQGPETFVDFKHPEHVPTWIQVAGMMPGITISGVESQVMTTLRLAQMYALFRADLDGTTVDQDKRMVTIHRPDGVSDFLQRVEHGALIVLGDNAID